MPMTKRQLAQVEADYAGFIPPGEVVSVRERRKGWGDTVETCDICANGFPDKVIVLENPMRSLYPQLRQLRVFVCRNGVACRRRATACSAPPAAAA